MNEYVLLLGANQYLRERSLAGAKSVTNLPIWTADSNPKVKINRYFDNCIMADPQNSESLLKEIMKYKELGWSPRAVIPLNDWTLMAANDVNRELGLKHLSSESVFLARNKLAMKEAFIANGVQTAPFVLVENESELKQAVNQIGFPVIIKPYEFGGSGGVYLARDMKEAIESFKESQDIMNQYAEQFGVDGNKYLIEKYIDSREEISVEVVCFNGRYEVITMTEKYLSPEPWFAEMAHLVPSHRVNDNAIKEMACKACEALKIEFGLAHVEIKIDGHNFWVIEAAARPGGDGIMDQIERAYELNPYSLHVSTYLNKEPFSLIDNVKAKATAAIAFLKADTGIIKEVNQPSVIDEEIHSLSIQADVGKISEDPICWRAREGVVEYTWPILFEEKTEKPIELTQNLSRQIFVVEKV